MVLKSNLINFITHQGNAKTYWVAYSGGLDSHALLHLLVILQKEYNLSLKAIHINHSLHCDADSWQEHCARTCSALHTDFYSQKINLQLEPGESLEAKARELRYHALATYLQAEDILLTAHHQNDQAETLLLQLLRGAGIQGLASMPTVKSFAKGFHARPFLDVSREQIKAYALENNLHWIEDGSNANLSFKRNYIRHEVIPLLQQQWPNAVPTLARVARNCADANKLLQNESQKELSLARGSAINTLSVKYLLSVPEEIYHQIIRAWFAEKKLVMPNRGLLGHIKKNILLAKQDAQPEVDYAGKRLKRYQDNIFIIDASNNHSLISYEMTWDLAQPLLLPNKKILTAVSSQTYGLRKDIGKVCVRFKKPGEKIQIFGEDCHREIKKLFQEWGVPPWLREQVPLVFSNNLLVAAVGYFMAKRASNPEGYRLVCQ